jgi:hypothetical protein
VAAELAEEEADVVPNRRLGQPEASRDLARRDTLREKLEHLALTRAELGP